MSMKFYVRTCNGRSPKTGKRVGSRHRWLGGYTCDFCGRTQDQVRCVPVQSKPVLHSTHPADITKHRHGWLRPDGKFFACDREGHLGLLDDLKVSWKTAEDGGWCKIGTQGGETFFYHVGVISGGEATQAQINAVDRHCAAFKVELPYWAGGKD